MVQVAKHITFTFWHMVYSLAGNRPQSNHERVCSSWSNGKTKNIVGSNVTESLVGEMVWIGDRVIVFELGLIWFYEND